MPKAIPPSLDDDGALAQGRSLARHYSRGTAIDPHAHEWAQILYAVSGVMWVEIEREALIVPPQRAVWLPPGTLHSVRMMTEVDMRNLYFQEPDARHLGGQAYVFEVNSLLKELISSIAEREAERDTGYLSVAYHFATLELSYASQCALSIPLPGDSDRRLQTLCQAVIDNPSVNISFEQHATSAGASVRTLSRLFTRELGMGFAEWRRQVQLAIALSRLAEGQPVSSIAASLGYLPSSFSDMFRRELGTSPTSFDPASR